MRSLCVSIFAWEDMGLKPTLIQELCARDREHLLDGWSGIPADRLESVIRSFGLDIKHENLGLREGALDMRRGLVLVNSRLPELCDPRTDLNGVRNSILAHELGHWRLHRNLLEAGAPLTQRHEEQAYIYAEEFLLPRDLLRMRPQIWEMARARKKMERMPSDRLWFLVEEISNHFQVTRASVAFRLERLELIHRSRGQLGLSRPGRPAAPAAETGLSCAT